VGEATEGERGVAVAAGAVARVGGVVGAGWGLVGEGFFEEEEHVSP